MTLVFFADISWDGLFQRPQHLARALAREMDVVFVEPAAMIEKVYFRPRQVESNLRIISVPSIPYNARNPKVKAVSQRLASSRMVQSAVTAGQFAILKNALSGMRGPVGVVIESVMQYDLARRLNPRFVVYDYIDNIFGFSAVPGPIKDQWERCASAASLVTVTSPALERQIRPYRSGPIEYLGNGADVEFFSADRDVERPADLPQGKPIVGYVGAVYPWLNYDMLDAAARALPEINFVLLGRTHPEIEHRLERLRALGNVFTPGFKPYAQIPSYLKFMDVCTIPFQYNELTAAVNPVKVYEYSAAGKPTISTGFSEDIRRHAGTITIVDTPEQFIAGIGSILAAGSNPDTVSSLRAFARSHDWAATTSRFTEIVRESFQS